MWLWILAAYAADYAVTDLGTLGGRSAAASAINERGQIVGISNLAGPEQHAFQWQDGKMVDLGTLGGRNSAAWDINNRGQAVGGAQDEAGRTRAVRWDDGVPVDLGALEGGNFSFAIAINDAGQVAGFSQTEGGETHAVSWDADGRATDLGTLGGDFSYAIDVNERGEVLAMSTTGEGHRAFVWRAGEQTEIGAAPWSSGLDLNDAGQVVGSVPAPDASRMIGYRWSPGGQIETFGLGGDVVIVAAVNEAGHAAGFGTLAGAHPGTIEASLRREAGSPADGLDVMLVQDGEVEPTVEVHAFVYRDGTVTDLGTLGGPHASAVDINRRGQIVGTSARADGKPRAYVWHDGVMTELDTPGVGSAGASDINDAGQIVGAFGSPGERRAFVAVPCEPGAEGCGPVRGTR